MFTFFYSSALSFAFFELINACATICQSKCHLAVDLHPAIAAALLKLKSIILCECRLSTTTTGTGTFFNSLTVMEEQFSSLFRFPSTDHPSIAFRKSLAGFMVDLSGAIRKNMECNNTSPISNRLELLLAALAAMTIHQRDTVTG